MPTVREKLDAGLAAGIPLEDLKARSKELGLEKEDLDLDYEQAKQKGAARLAAKKASVVSPAPTAPAPAAPPTPAPAAPTQEPGMLGAVKQLRRKAGVPEPTPGSGEAWRERPDVAVDIVPVERPAKPLSVLDLPGMAARGLGSAVADQMAVAEAQKREKERLKTAVKKEEELTGEDEFEKPDKKQDWTLEFPTPLSLSRRGVAALAGLTKSLTGESEAGRAVDLAAAGAAELLDPFASEQQKKQRARDVYESYMRYRKGGAGVLVQPAGWEPGESEATFDTRMKKLYSEGKYGELIRNALPAPIVHAYERTEQERKEKGAGVPTSAAKVAQTLENAVSDLGSITGGLAVAANNLLGITVEPVHGRREQGAYETGESLSPTAMAGMSANLLKGLASVDANSMQTHPFSTWLMAISPVREAMHKAAPVKMQAAEAALDNVVKATADKLVKTIPGGERMRDGIIRGIRNGLYQGDRQLAGELDAFASELSAKKANAAVLADKIANIAAREGVEFEQTPVEPRVEVLKGAPAKGKAQAAVKNAVGAVKARAEAIADARQTELDRAEAKAERAQDKVDLSIERAERAEGRQAGAELKAEGRLGLLEEREAKAKPERLEEVRAAADEELAKMGKSIDEAQAAHQEARQRHVDALADKAAADTAAEAARVELEAATKEHDALKDQLKTLKGTGRGKGRVKAQPSETAALDTALAKIRDAELRVQEAERRAAKSQERADKLNTVQAKLSAQRRQLEVQDAANAVAATKARYQPEVIKAAGETIPTEEIYTPATTTAAEAEQMKPLEAKVQAIADRAETARQEALLAGYDPNAPVPAAILDPVRKFVPQLKGNTIGEIGQEIAHDLTWHIPDKAKVPGIIQGALENMGVPSEAAAPAARFLVLQQEMSRLARVKEVPAGNIRRPEPVVTRAVIRDGRIQPEGLKAEMGLQLAGERAKAVAEHKAGELSAEDLERRQRAFSELERMAAHGIESEKPVPFKTTNPELNELADKIANQVLDAYQPSYAYEGGYRQLAIELGEAMPAVGETVMQAGMDLHKLSKERLLQRIFEPFQRGSTSLLRVPSARSAYSNLFKAKLRELGYKKGEALDLQQRFNEMINNPEEWNAHSKNRRLELVDDKGNLVWGMDDYLNGLESIAPNKLNKYKAEASKMIVDSMADSAHGYGVQRMIAEELYRPFRNPDGTYRTEVKGDPQKYAQALAEMVEDRGEMLPFAMPYSGEVVAARLRAIGRNALAERVERARFADATAKKGPAVNLVKTLTSWHKEQFRGTDLPPDLINMHVQASVANGLNAHFSMLHGVANQAPFFRFLHDLVQRSKTMVVAASIPSIINNDVSNIIGMSFKRADPLIALKTAQAYLADHAWRQGKLTGDLALDFDALATTDIRDSTQVMSELRRQHGNQFTQLIESKFPDFMRGVNKLDMRLGEWPSKFALGSERLNDIIIHGFQELGDLPSRMEYALDRMHHVDHTMGAMEIGKELRIPISDVRFIKLERVGDSLFRSTDTLRRDAVVKEFERGSAEARELQAQYGNYMQSLWFGNYNKLGNYAKRLRTPTLGWLSGIFTWYWQARDIPLVKKGLVSRMLENGDGIWTNDPTVLGMQASERFALAMRKAILTSAGNNAWDDQANIEQLRRSVSMSPANDAMVLYAATDPTQAYAKDLGPVVFATPTKKLFRGLQWVAEEVAYGSGFNDANTIMHMIAPTAEDLAERERMSPEDRRDLEVRLKGMKRYLSGTTFEPRDFFDMFGCAGAPLVQPLFKLSMQYPGYTVERAKQDYTAQFFGKTVNSTLQVLSGGAGLALGNEWLLGKSGYGAPSDVSRRGLVNEDVSTFMQWVLSKMMGLGWRTTQLTEGTNRVTGKQMSGAIEMMLRKAHEVVREAWMPTFDNKVALEMSKLEKDPQAIANARMMRARVENGAKQYFRQSKADLHRQAAALRKKNVD